MVISMRRIILFAIVANFAIVVSAQTVSNKYFVGAFSELSQTDTVWKEGLNRIDGESIIFLITSGNPKYKIALNHFSYLNRPTDPVILDMPIAELEQFDEVVPAEQLLEFKDAESAYSWMMEAFTAVSREMYYYNEIRTKLYVIDTNKFYKSDPALDEPDMMKVVEVRIWDIDIPDDILAPKP